MTINNINTLIVYSDEKGITRLSGMDINRRTWIEVEVDYFAEQSDLICNECEVVTDRGWLCMDGGEERCINCVKFVTPIPYFIDSAIRRINNVNI